MAAINQREKSWRRTRNPAGTTALLIIGAVRFRQSRDSISSAISDTALLLAGGCDSSVHRDKCNYRVVPVAATAAPCDGVRRAGAKGRTDSGTSTPKCSQSRTFEPLRCYKAMLAYSRPIISIPGKRVRFALGIRKRTSLTYLPAVLLVLWSNNNQNTKKKNGIGCCEFKSS